MKSLLYYFQKAQKEKWAVPHLNVSSAVEMKGVVQAAKNQQAPIIIAVSSRAAKAIGMLQALALVQSYRKETNLPLFLNFDHGKDITEVLEAINLGFDMVHYDGSNVSIEENIAQTQRATAEAQKKGILVEGELGKIVGDHTFDLNKIVIAEEKHFTDPNQVEEFIKKTKVDLLATIFGSVHGVYKEMPHLNFERLNVIEGKVGKTFLVLHGGSGIDEKDIQKAISLGVVKINVSTELKYAFTSTLRKVFEENLSEVSSYKLFPQAIDEVTRIAEGKIQLFGASNKSK